MALILCTGADKELLKTRQIILERSGHQVLTADDEHQLVDLCHSHTFDLAVIGQSIGNRMKLHAMNLLREHCPSVKILELYAANMDRALKEADAWLEMPTEDPQAFVDAVKALTTKAAA